MPNEIEPAASDRLVRLALENGIQGFIFSNLVKDRSNPVFGRKEIARFNNLKGNFSGKPCETGANKLVARTRKKFGWEVALIGCGGVFSPADAGGEFEAGGG